MQTHIMVDLETLGNSLTTGALIAIGAVAFNMHDELPYPHEADFIEAYIPFTFFRPISLVQQYESYGLRIEDDTLQWWLHPDRYQQLQAFLTSPKSVSIGTALYSFELWVASVCKKQDDLMLWSHGATYDCMHLAEKWPIVVGRSFNTVCQFRQVRDTRTIFAAYEESFGKSPYPAAQRKRHHHPLEDSWMQAKAVQIAWNGLVHG